jgi:hypothetical protein
MATSLTRNTVAQSYPRVQQEEARSQIRSSARMSALSLCHTFRPEAATGSGAERRGGVMVPVRCTCRGACALLRSGAAVLGELRAFPQIIMTTFGASARGGADFGTCPSAPPAASGPTASTGRKRIAARAPRQYLQV